MNRELKVVAANLQRDVEVLLAALRSCAQARITVQERYPAEHIQIPSGENTALWVHYRLGGDWSKFVELACQALDACSGDKSQVWVWGGPENESPEPDAIRHLDRIAMALNMISKELDIMLPEKNYDRIKYYERIKSFVQAANDVLNPETEPPRRMRRL